MLKKIFKPVKIGGATALISLASLLSYAIGLVRDGIIASKFGATTATDAYGASFIIPDILFNLFIAGALMAAFMPVFAQYLEKDEKEAHKLANTMLTGASLLITILSITAFIFMRPLVETIFSTASLENQESIINMTRLMLPSAILFAISNTLGNILMTYKHFIGYAISPILYNAGIILGIIFLSEKYGIYSAAIGVLIGAALHTVIRLIEIGTTPYKFKPQIQFNHPGFKKILKLMAPRSLSLIAWQINLYIFAIVGMRMIDGGFAAFNYARNIQSFSVSLFGIAFATATFPYLNSAASQNDMGSYTRHIQKTIQRILFFTIPAMVGLFMMSQEVVEIILGRGVFDQKATDLTSILLIFFAISIPFESITQILARGFYALKNTITPMIISVGSMTIIALITYFIAPKFGIQWFSIGFSIGFALIVILQTLFLKKHFEGFNLKQLLISITKTTIASITMGIVIHFSSGLENYLPLKISHVARIIISAGLYFVAAAIVKSPELASTKYIFNKLFRPNKANKSLSEL